MIALSKESSFFITEQVEKELFYLLNRLSCKKLSWDLFLQKVEDPFLVSRMATVEEGKSLLHLAVLDNRLDLIKTLGKDASLKERRDLYGLNAIELAELLERKEALDLLRSTEEIVHFPEIPTPKDFAYLSHPVFETKEGMEQVLKITAKAKKEDAISAEKIWMGIYFDKEIRKGAHPPISIRYIDEEIGHGVFAEKKILPCTFVGEYTGVIQERSPKQLKNKMHCLRYAIWGGKKSFAIDAEKRGNFTRFINHSDTPNIEVQSVYWRGIPRMIFVSLKEIKEGSQLTFDYGPLYWENLAPPKNL